MNIKIINKYFPNLSESQKSQFEQLFDLYADWNSKINVISRKDIENLYEHHVLHSLAIAEFIHFKGNTRILDIGTGGGFPGIPLAIFFPDVNFTLIDSIGKKIKVAKEIAKEINLKNIDVKQIRLEEEKGKYDFAISRAVMPLADLVKLSRKNISKEQKNAISNGIICLKGGELTPEILPFQNLAEIYEISNFFDEEYFKTKKMVFLPFFSKK